MTLVVMDEAFDGDEVDCGATDDCANVTMDAHEAIDCVQTLNDDDSVFLWPVGSQDDANDEDSELDSGTRTPLESCVSVAVALEVVEVVVPLVGPCKTSSLDWTSEVVVLLINHYHDPGHFLQ